MEHTEDQRRRLWFDAKPVENGFVLTVQYRRRAEYELAQTYVFSEYSDLITFLQGLPPECGALLDNEEKSE